MTGFHLRLETIAHFLRRIYIQGSFFERSDDFAFIWKRLTVPNKRKRSSPFYTCAPPLLRHVQLCNFHR